jgi:glycosyl transferase family 2
VRTIAEIVRRAGEHAPVLVVDDGSTDGTADAACAAGASVITHARRAGKGAALATAFAEARARSATRVLTLDGDGQHDPGDIPALLAASRAAPRAVILGARRDREALVQHRALAMGLASYWMNWVSGVAISDTQSGFRVYPMALLDDVPCPGGRFVFETQVLVDAIRRGWPVREVAIRTVPCASRASRFNPVRDGVAIGAYLAGGAVRRWGVECAAGVREVAMIFSHERRIARHSEILARASVYAGTPGWGAAVGMAAAGAMRGRLTAWWQHPRLRRARRASVATLAAPPALIVVGLATGVPALVPGGLTRLVRRIYDARALPPVGPEPPVAHDGDARAWAAVSR